ncbi:YdgA family protein [Iodobacter sp. LRB]|uniref:YdgA family protein n=1 Tax=unclassified Iodobacter TaxID=235634 RepID=UPI000C0E6249|nr:YdgA family protein [Iodobacter sp. BJB302]PHV03449.1 hypothetical protein CSQ88_01690 [Iodobacter sp. BJB302]
MNKTKLALALAVLAGAGFAGATWYAGSTLDHKVSEAGDALKDYKIVKVVKRDFKKGFWTSTEEVTYQLGCEDGGEASPLHGATGQITLINTIEHNPFGLAINTKVVYSDKTREELAKVFKGKEPLEINTKVSLSGDLQTRISSPAFTVDDEKGNVNWKGFNSLIKYDKHASYIDFDFAVNGAEGKESNNATQFKLGAISYKGNYKNAADGVYAGAESLTVEGFDVSSKKQEKDIQVSMGQLLLNSESKLNNGLLDFSGKGTADKIKFNSKEIGKFEMNLSVSQIDPKAIKGINELSWKKGILQCNFDGKSQAKAMQALLMDILKKNPSMKQNIKLHTPEGESMIALDLSSKDIKQEDLENPGQLINKVNAMLALQLPNAFAERMIRESAEEEAIEPTLEMFQSSVQLGVEDGKLESDGKLLKTKIQLKDGKIVLNGKTVELPELLGMH